MSRLFMVLLAFSLSLGTDARAQAKWTAQCATDRMTDMKACAMGRSVRAGQRQVMIALKDGQIGVLTNNYLSVSRARIRVDKLPYIQTGACSRDTCLFDIDSSFELIEQMAEGTVALVDLSLRNGELVGPIEVPLAGFKAELVKLTKLLKE